MPGLNMRRWSLPLALLIAGGVFIAGLRIYIARAEHELHSSRLWIPKPTKITPEVALLQQYVRIDTSIRRETNFRVRDFWPACSKRTASTPRSSNPRRAAPAFTRASPAGSAATAFSFSITSTSFPPKSGWTHPPFAADVELNQMYGRGTLDMKGVAICELLAFIDVARTRRMPERDIVFLAVADEEAGGKLGTAWLLEHRPDVFAGIRYAINEGGITETTQERISYFGIEIGTKMTVRMRLARATGSRCRRAHRTRAVHHAHHADRVLPGVREFLQTSRRSA